MNEHPSGGTRGGASVEPTPANNVGGGRGWGDSGFFKGGTGGEGTGHISVCLIYYYSLPTPM